jgi:hypothetical protein
MGFWATKISILGTPKSLALGSPHFSEGKTYKPKNIHKYKNIL